MFGAIKKTYAERGFLGFYRGYGALLLFSVPKNKLNNFLCGLAAGSSEAIFVVTPQETVKTKLIHDRLSENPKYRNVFHGIKTIVGQ